MRPAARLIATVVVASATVAGQAPDAASLLAAARRALGGEAALRAITTFTVDGSVGRGVNRPTSAGGATIDIRSALPDKFIRVIRRTVNQGSSGNLELIDALGFNGDAPLQDVGAAGPRPAIPAGPEPRTPTDPAAARRRQTNTSKHRFVEFAFPLFATSFAAYPLTFAAAGQSRLPTGLADAVDLKGPDGFRWRLFLDASSHLPVRLTWMEAPAVSTRGATSGGQATAAVEWQITIGDYRVADGLNWPHRFTTEMAGQTEQEMRLGTFKINTQIDPKIFAPR